MLNSKSLFELRTENKSTVPEQNPIGCGVMSLRQFLHIDTCPDSELVVFFNNMSKMKSYRTCFVPLCTNNTKRTPQKLFLNVPQNVEYRKKWFQAARRPYPNTKSHFHCCEDHFDLREDMENYMYYTTMGGNAKIKDGVVPHEFNCQPDRKSNTTLKPAEEKRRRQQIIEEILSESAKSIEINNSQESNLDTIPVNNADLPDFFSAPSKLAEKVSVKIPTYIEKRAVAVQVTCRPKLYDVSIQCKFISSLEDHDSISPRNFTYNLQDMYEPSEDTGSSTIDSRSFQSPVKQAEILKVTNFMINNNLKAYTGVPDEWNGILENISDKSKISIINIKLTLMKIRCQDTFERLREQFALSISDANIIFNETIPVLAHLLKTLIYMPESSDIKRILPIPFWSSYSHVNAIIDTFEIQVERPSDPEYQSMTWSEYKKCYILKFLISVTPDGFINFISKGFGGRISDEVLFQVSGLLDQLPEDCAVMADRGFKNIDSLLEVKNIKLVRPPSVSSGVKLSRSDLLEGKRIARALRIHLERVIGIMREFDLLRPHAVINDNMLPFIDYIVVIAAALVNLQAPSIAI